MIVSASKIFVYMVKSFSFGKKLTMHREEKMKVFRGVVLGVTIAFIIWAILALVFVLNLEMCLAVIIGAVIVAALNIVSAFFWWKEKRLILFEMKWAGIDLELK